MITSSFRMDVRGRNGADGVQALVVLRPVEVHAQSLAIGGERMAVGAGVHALEHHLAARFGEIAQPPGDQRNGRRRQRLDDALLRLRRASAARRDRKSARPAGSRDVRIATEPRETALTQLAVAEAGNGHGRRMRHRVLLDLGLTAAASGIQVRAAACCGVRRGGSLVPDAQRGIDLADAQSLARGWNADGWGAVVNVTSISHVRALPAVSRKRKVGAAISGGNIAPGSG